MVQRPFPASAEMKPSRSSASFSQDYRPFDTPTPDSIISGHFASHWAILYMDKNNCLRESSNLSSSVFSDKAREEFIIASEKSERRDNASLLPSASAFNFSHVSHSRRSGRAKRRKGIQEESLVVEYMEPMEEETDLVPLEIGDTRKVTAYYDSAFKRMQQLNCRMLAKGFIKLIEPRKQVKHPYNGGKPPAGSPPGTRGDPERTKPDWWPQGVMHREPDHLRKERKFQIISMRVLEFISLSLVRLRLLVHIVQNLSPIGITADKLQEIANDNRRQIKPPEKIGILDELFRVRRLEERYERNEVDANAVIFVIDHEGAKNREPDSDDEEGELTQQTPNESDNETLSDQSRSPINMVTASQQISPIDTSSSFTLSPDANFGGQDQSVHHFQSSQPEMNHPTMISTPISAPILSPTPNQYMTHSTFAPPTSHEAMQPLTVSHPLQSQMSTQTTFPGWSPAFQQNMFAPVEYPVANRQILPQMAFPGYTVCPTPHTHTISSHSVPDLERSQMDLFNMGSIPFRSGSLSHPNVLPRPDNGRAPSL
ncbi:hypothetical protein BGW36DRAFT_116075 [Talaromyces proteolyticus]|uniref:Subtelomeric hrmA-associated cluster protein AFUB-079030/YDR124W-like helical bundle domain-containing protein n=1 Tax=Talaromyces proteolyticus TaxID=1131652 RepID=A0AAD4KWA3_9EURO|nr:uncharacterized protein BGW36DRAFT_116075 [Talaromyces proteolyticus]KAH8702387.1 hypothetical protein BGW36DRAFT_116075 [Talaromyces proteolyticus]